MNNHLTFTKWKDSAFSTEQLRTTRWLLGARPKNTVENYQDMLTVTAQAQCMLMELHIKCFTNATRRMKASARNRARANAEEFDKLVDFACVFSYIRQCAKRATAKPDVDAKLLSAFLSKTLSMALVLALFSYIRICCVCRVTFKLCNVFGGPGPGTTSKTLKLSSPRGIHSFACSLWLFGRTLWSHLLCQLCFKAMSPQI